MTEWVYESPDGGKTIIRRKPLTQDKEVLVDASYNRGWVSLSLVKEIADKAIFEQEYRDKYPDLNDLWIQYHTLLGLLAQGPHDDYM